MSEKKVKVYFAAPFFNPDQVALNDSLIKAIESVEGVSVWAPQRDGILCPKDASEEVRHKVFCLDAEQISACQCMVAVLDYLGADLCRIPDTQESASVVDLPHINLPDAGTVWEMGYAYSVGLPILGFSTSGSGFNLMLSQSLVCLVDKVTDLTRSLGLTVQAQIADSQGDNATYLSLMQRARQFGIRSILSE